MICTVSIGCLHEELFPKRDSWKVELARLCQHNRGNYTTPTIFSKKNTNTTGQEYTYDNVRDLLEAKKRTKLYAQNDFDLEKYLEIQELVSTNEERIAELEELKTCVEPVKVTSA